MYLLVRLTFKATTFAPPRGLDMEASHTNPNLGLNIAVFAASIRNAPTG